MAKKYADYNTLERMLYNIKLKFAALVHTHVPSEVGLSNVENKSGATIRSEMTQTEVTNALTYTPVPTTNIVDPKVATETGFAADAKLTGDAIGELNKKIGAIKTEFFTANDLAFWLEPGVYILINDYQISGTGTIILEIYNFNKDHSFGYAYSLNSPSELRGNMVRIAELTESTQVGIHVNGECTNLGARLTAIRLK